MKLLVFNDLHASATPPISRIDNYMESFFRKVDEICRIVKKEDCSYVLIPGDFFHLKSATRNPYYLVNRMIDAFSYMRSSCQGIFGIFGDHDVPDRRVESLVRQPLWTLAKASGILLLDKNYQQLLGDGVWLTGAPKTDDYESYLDNYSPKVISDFPGGFIHIHLSHGDLLPTEPVYAPFTLYSQLFNSHVDFLFNGHIHEPQKTAVVGKTTIVAQGSLMRGALTQDNIKRIPMVTVLDTKTRKLETIHLKSALPPEQVFDLERYEQVKKAEQEILRVSGLIKYEADNIELSGIESIRQLVRELKDIDEKVKTVIFELLDKSEEFG